MTSAATRPPRPFWEHPLLLVVLVFASATPLLIPSVPPLTDLPGHIARYHVELNLDSSPYLRRHFDFEWMLIGNLGVDLLIIPMAKLFGLELGAKLIVIAIPVLMVAGFLAVAHEIHGRIPPTALFALPLAYCFPFQFGFVNFSLSTALCFLAFALWLRLGRTGRIGLRALLFLPLACAIWVCHTYGWGLLGVLAFAAETVRRHRNGTSWFMAPLRGGLDCLPLMPPFLLMLMWRSGAVAGKTVNWFDWVDKALWLVSILRERWAVWDIAGAALLAAVPLWALLRRRPRIAPELGLAALLLLLLFILIPRVVIGSGYADMRLAPFVIAVAILAVVPSEGNATRNAQHIAIAALVFFAARLAVTTTTFISLDRTWQQQLAAIDHIEPGSRVLVLANIPCRDQWASRRMEHVSSLAVVRRDAFTNGQWALAGAQLLRLVHPRGGPFFTDPSHLLRPASCGGNWAKLDRAVSLIPDGFDYLWLIDMPKGQWPADERLAPVWRNDSAILYRGAARRSVGANAPLEHQAR